MLTKGGGVVGGGRDEINDVEKDDPDNVALNLLARARFSQRIVRPPILRFSDEIPG